MHGKKTRDTILKKNPQFYSEISRKRRVFSGGKTFKDKDRARAAQLRSAAARKKNNELRRAAEQPDTQEG